MHNYGSMVHDDGTCSVVNDNSGVMVHNFGSMVHADGSVVQHDNSSGAQLCKHGI